MAKWIYYNPNPFGAKVGDCVIRAISAATKQDWDKVYTGLAFQGFALKDMPSSNYVWGEYLQSKGFEKGYLPKQCPLCTTIGEFADDHPEGVYVIGTGTHAVCIRDGNVLDNWNSLNCIVDYYFYREE